ncbi:MAG: 2-hydroxyacid dehydrogenase [Nocardioides sp.]|uniref:2-hydroxyacid dehydrogenase n=1 Tax=Nocardioides sp. TaxID=35761 RepID=UPI0039E29B63
MTRLVWLPIDPADLGELPGDLAYEVVRSTDPVPPGAENVELWVPPSQPPAAYEAAFAAMASLQVVQTMSAGIDSVKGLVPDGVALHNARGVHDTATAEHAVALTLAAQRAIPVFAEQQGAGAWKQFHTPGLGDKTVLIVGYGSIGRAIARRLEGFEADVVKVARTARDGVHGLGELPALVPRADVVILMTPLTDTTRGMVGAEFLSWMRPGALLVNVARGPVVDTDALVEACAAGRIRAAVDVTDPEPLSADHPLWRTPNVLVTPHVGGDTDAEAVRLHRLLREQLTRFAAGEPLVNEITGDY